MDVGHQEHKKDRKKAPSKDPNALQMALDSGGIFVCIMLSLALSCAIVAASTIGKDATIDIFMSTERAAREDTQGTYRSFLVGESIGTLIWKQSNLAKRDNGSILPDGPESLYIWEDTADSRM